MYIAYIYHLHSGHVKINDFGLSQVKQEILDSAHDIAEREGLGSLPWMAPEIIEQEPPQTAADVFRF